MCEPSPAPAGPRVKALGAGVDVTPSKATIYVWAPDPRGLMSPRPPTASTCSRRPASWCPRARAYGPNGEGFFRIRHDAGRPAAGGRRLAKLDGRPDRRLRGLEGLRPGGEVLIHPSRKVTTWW